MKTFRKIVSVGLQVIGVLTVAALLLSVFGDNVRRLLGHSSSALSGSDERALTFMAPSVAAPAPSEGASGEMDDKALAGPGGGGMGGKADKRKAEAHRSAAAPKPSSPAKDSLGAVAEAPEAKGGVGGEQASQPAATREWFPESFLFEPLVVTNEAGIAHLPARVPDRLTSWRVLALAHSRSGLQAGAVTSFLGTLPAYVEPIIPPFLITGDEVRLPIQLVNTTPQALQQLLKVEATGARLPPVSRSVLVPASGNRVEYAVLHADHPGTVTLKAMLGNTDAVVRNFPVQPSGKPVDQAFGGTLAAPRSLDIETSPKADPETGRVRLLVYPGALALLRSELSAASGRGGVASDAYALLLAGNAPELLKSLGEKPDLSVLRDLTLITSQRAFAAGRNPDLTTATLLAEAALAHRSNPVLERLGERMAGTVAGAQRPDGTFGGQTGWTLQRLLVTTADALRAVRAGAVDKRSQQRATAASLRASGAFERHIKLVEDGYTAAAILASGGVTGTLADQLRAKVRDSVVQSSDGSRSLRIESGVVRADGTIPSSVEGTALAALALEGDKEAPWRSDLGAYLLGSYRPESGWGDGRANLACLRAVLTLFKDPLPPSVHITLELDGKLITEGTLDTAHVREVLGLEAAAPGAAGAHSWVVKAEPPVPGLGFALTLRTWVPWETESGDQGFEMTLTTPQKAKVGQAADIDVRAVAPSGTSTRIRHALPAGVQADRASLERLKADGVISGFEVEDGAVVLEVPARAAGEAFNAHYRVIPTLAGTLHATASSIAPTYSPELAYYLPPAVWSVE